MKDSMKRKVGLAAGVFILLLDVYWTWLAWNNEVPRILGLLILAATIVWLWADL